MESSSSEFFEATWPDIVTYFQEAVRIGRAADAVKLLRDCDRLEKWRPLGEALTAIAEKSIDRLLRLPPEMQKPATELYHRLTEDVLTSPSDTPRLDSLSPRLS